MIREASAMPQFILVDLSEDRLDSVYPLVRAAMPEVSRRQWLDYGREVLARGGMVGLGAPDGSLFGFLTWRTETSLRRGRILRVDDFVTFELSRAGAGRKALCEAADEIARARGCEAVELRLGSRSFGSVFARADGWSELGHVLDGVHLVRPIVPEHGRAPAANAA